MKAIMAQNRPRANEKSYKILITIANNKNLTEKLLNR
jgi:hypothetical protein